MNEIGDKSPREFFELMADGLFDLLVEESSRYASQKNSHSFTCTTDEYRALLGVRTMIW